MGQILPYILDIMCLMARKLSVSGVFAFKVTVGNVIQEVGATLSENFLRYNTILNI